MMEEDFFKFLHKQVTHAKAGYCVDLVSRIKIKKENPAPQSKSSYIHFAYTLKTGAQHT